MGKFVTLTAGVKVPISVLYRHHGAGSEIRLVWAKRGVQGLIERAAEAAKKADAVILVVGTNHAWDGEGHDKPSLAMFGDEDALTTAVLHARRNAVVTLVNGTAIEMPWINDASTVLEAWYGGSRAGDALARILFGDVCPSGKLPITFPVKLADSPAHANGDYPPKDGILKYDEGILVGYRWYDTKQVVPLFRFGYGLSYTRFLYSDLKLQENPDGITVKFKLRNVGEMKGMETAQVYVRAKDSKVPRAMQELKGFAKLALNKGQSRGATIELPRRAFAYYSVEKKDWFVDPGAYEIAVGASSQDIRLAGRVTLK